MNWASLISTILQALPALITGVDSLFVKGTDKKAAVMNIVTAAVPVAASADPKNAQAISALASAAIDTTVATMNDIGALQHSVKVS